MIANQIALLYIIILILALFGLYISSRISSETNYLRRLFLSNFLLRVCLVLFLAVKIVPVFRRHIMGDELNYDRIAHLIAQAWQEGYNPGIRGPAPGFIYFSASIYFLFGYNPTIVKIFNSFIGALIPIFVYIIAKHAYGEGKIAKTAATLVSLLPSLLIYSITQLKEIHVIFILTFVIGGLMELRRKFSIVLLIAIALVYIDLMFLRFYYCFPLLISAIIYMIICYSPQDRIKGVLYGALLLLLVGLTMDRLGYSLFGLAKQLSTIIQYKYDAPDSNILYPVFSRFGRIALLPISTSYSLLMPNPLWLFFNPYYKIQPISWLFLIDSIVWYILIPFSAYGFFSSLKNRNNEKLLLCLLSFSIICLSAISGQGLITAGRHKDSVMPFFMIFAGVGIIDYIRGNFNIRLLILLYAALLYGSSLLYIYMKFSSRMIQPFIIITGCTLVALVFLTILKDRI